MHQNGKRLDHATQARIANAMTKASGGELESVIKTKEPRSAVPLFDVGKFKKKVIGWWPWNREKVVSAIEAAAIITLHGGYRGSDKTNQADAALEYLKQIENRPIGYKGDQVIYVRPAQEGHYRITVENRRKK